MSWRLGNAAMLCRDFDEMGIYYGRSLCVWKGAVNNLIEKLYIPKNKKGEI